MIPLLVIYLFKRYPVLKNYLTGLKSLLLVSVTFLLTSFTGFSTVKMNYLIKRNGKTIGKLVYGKTEINNLITYNLESKVTDKIIFSIVVNAKEETVYENGLLKSFSSYREQNGEVKTDKKVVVRDNKYYTTEHNKTVASSYYPVNFSVMHLYLHEPLQNKKVFAENAQKMIAIEKQQEHLYKVPFSNGSYNLYYYANGICNKIEVHHFLFTVIMELVK